MNRRTYTLVNNKNSTSIDVDVYNYDHDDHMAWQHCLHNELMREFGLTADQVTALLLTYSLGYVDKNGDICDDKT